MLFRLRTMFAIIGSAMLAAATVAAQSQAEWHSLTTKNFTVIGNASAPDIGAEVARLENFRTIFSRLYPSLKLGDVKPTTIVLFKDPAAFGAVLPKRGDGRLDDGVTGYFLEGERQNYIALAFDEKRETAHSPILHEFIHLVLASNSDVASLPPWLDEGLAEYFDAADVSNDGARLIGRENRSHLQLLSRVGLIPVSELVAIDGAQLRSMPVKGRQQFYAESWLLVRQLIADGKLKLDDLSQQLGEIKAGAASHSAIFGIDTAVLQASLTRALNERSRKFATLRVMAPDGSVFPSVAYLADEHAFAVIGDMLLQIGDADRAEVYVKQALARNKNEPLANALFGKLLVDRNELTEAKTYLKIAIDGGSTDHWVYYYYAFVLSQEFIVNGMIGDIKDSAAGEMLRALRHAIDLDPNFVESYRLAALIDLARDEDLDEASMFLKRAVTIKPEDADLKLLLARIMLRRDDAGSARRLAGQVAASADANKKTEAAEIIKTADEVTGARTAANIPVQLSISVARQQPVAVLKRSWLTDAELAQIEADRVNNNFNRLIIRPHPGEQQAVGRIQRITCSGSDVTYDVNTGSDKLTFKSAGFDNIRMTVAQEAGNSYLLGCGAKLDKVLTVINYQPSTIGRGVVTAISFVPDGFRLKSLKEMNAARMVAIDDDTLRRGSPPATVTEETAHRSIENDLRKPRKDEIRVLGQIENIECAGNNWTMKIVSDGRHLRFGPPRVGETLLGWFTVASTQIPLECGSDAVPAYAIFTYAKSDGLDGELRAIEFVPDGFTLMSAGR